jgi:hypothetical protein
VADTGWLDATTFATTAMLDAAWSSNSSLPSTVEGSPIGDSGSPTSSVRTERLIGAGYDFSAIPPGATITKIEGRVELTASANDNTDGPYAETYSDFNDGLSRLWDGSADFWPTSSDTGQIGTSPTMVTTDFGTGGGLTLADLDSDFGFNFNLNLAALTGQYFISATATLMQMRVTYTGGTPTFTGSGSLTLSPVTTSGTGRIDYRGSGTLTTGAALLAGTGSFTGTYTGSGALTLGAATLAGTGSFTGLAFSGSGSLSLSAATIAGTGTHTAPTYTGSGTLTLSAASIAGSGELSAPTVTGSASLLLGAVTIAGSGTHAAPAFTGSGELTIGAAFLDGSGTFGGLTFTGSGALTLGAVTMAGTGSVPVIIAAYFPWLQGTDAAMPDLQGYGDLFEAVPTDNNVEEITTPDQFEPLTDDNGNDEVSQ